MALITGVFAIVRMTSNMPRRLTETSHESPTCNISASEYMAMMKRLAELEEKVVSTNNKPMPSDKEAILTQALARVADLEQELSSTKKVLNVDSRNQKHH